MRDTMSTKQIMVRVRYTQEQRDTHQKKADSAGISLSEYLRQAGDNAEVYIKDNKVSLMAVSELNRFGNNLNQMAKAANKANLSGKLSNDLYRQFIQRLRIYTDEVHALSQIVKLQGDI